MLPTVLLPALWLSAAPPAPAAPAPAPTRVVKLADDCTLKLLSAAEAAAVLDAERLEPYVSTLTHVELEIRLGGPLRPEGRKAQLQRLRAMRAASTRDWTDAEAEYLTTHLRTVHKLLSAEFPGLLPREWKWVKTSGEGDARFADGYTVDDLIVLHEGPLGWHRKGNEERAVGLLSRMTFHMLARTRPQIREKAYPLLGFRTLTRLDWGGLEPRRLVHPDIRTPVVYTVRDESGRDVVAAPLLYSGESRFDPKKGSDLFRYQAFDLFEAEADPKTGVGRLLDADGKKPERLPRATTRRIYDAAVAVNSSNVMHPQNILADNFAMLVLLRHPKYGPELRDSIKPELIGRLAAVLKALPPAKAP